ncbi:hypothetical protein [Natronocalculus amylovorans]|uniref:Uncharacterized protein n=1 Tax=Natronocalculus amylovorans TaxID=2917812 RepID=A0AAE3KDL5_9EURY|nr:hypothetical protein [Natronocalculus amylovorans]MCL9818369.1 hypothetical protein [Natronocalculus amylovorans]
MSVQSPQTRETTLADFRTDTKAAESHSWENPETLDRLYNEEGLSTREIAAHFDHEVHSSKIKRLLHEHNLMPEYPEKSTHNTTKKLLQMDPSDLGSPTPQQQVRSEGEQ